MPQRDLHDTDYLPGKWLTHQLGASIGNGFEINSPKADSAA
jgi:hypothetical protein